MITKRKLLIGLGGVALTSMFPATVFADRKARTVVTPNGSWDGEVFHWNNLGGDPYTGSLQNAMNLVGIMNPEARVGILKSQANARKIAIKNGTHFSAMVSGKNPGWVATNVIANVQKWNQDLTRDAYVSYFYTRDGVEYRVTYVKECNNYCFDVYGAAMRCDPNFTIGFK